MWDTRLSFGQSQICPSSQRRFTNLYGLEEPLLLASAVSSCWALQLHQVMTFTFVGFIGERGRVRMTFHPTSPCSCGVIPLKTHTFRVLVTCLVGYLTQSRCFGLIGWIGTELGHGFSYSELQFTAEVMLPSFHLGMRAASPSGRTLGMWLLYW